MVYSYFISFNLGIVFLVLLVFGILQWLHIPAGSLIDWIIAVAIFEWLLAIVTVPWNIHFEAKEVIAEAAQSAEKGIKVDQKQVKYAQMVAKRSFFDRVLRFGNRWYQCHRIPQFGSRLALNSAASSRAGLSIFSGPAGDDSRTSEVSSRRCCGIA